METDVVKAFNAELATIYDAKPPMGRKKIQDISKAAMKAKSYYKHVVFCVEKFLSKCRVEYKIPVLYIIDSIIRMSKHHFKEKDVFGPRFLKTFSKTLSDLLSCPEADQPRVVRTLNLWVANSIFTAEEIAPFKKQCQDMGLDTDIERVERAVKGSQADLSIYGIKPQMKDLQKFEPSTTPPGPPPQAVFHHAPSTHAAASTTAPALSALAQPPHLAAFLAERSAEEKPSEEIPEGGGVSEAELLYIIKESNLDFNNAFSTDLGLLRKAHRVICPFILDKQKLAMQDGTIKKMLSSQFDYSDEEDSDGEGRKAKPEETISISHDAILDMARMLVNDPNVVNSLRLMQQERFAALNQVAQEAQARASAAAPHTLAVSGAGPGPFPPAALAQLNPAALRGLPMLPIVTQPNAAILNLLQNPLAANLLQPPGMRPPSGSNAMDPAHILAKHQELMKQLGQSGLPLSAGPAAAAAAGLLSNLPQTSVNTSMAPPNISAFAGANFTLPPPNQPSLTSQSYQAVSSAGLQPSPSPVSASLQQHSIGDFDFRESDKDDRKADSKRSRSRDAEDRHESKRRSKSKDDPERRAEKERKKMGLPPVRENYATVATRTLWFGRLPSIVSESEIKSALAMVGEPKRIKLLNGRACAFVTMKTRKEANEILNKIAPNLTIQKKPVKVEWGRGASAMDAPYNDWWEQDIGCILVPWTNLPKTTQEMERLCQDAHLDVDSLPQFLRGLFTIDGKAATPGMSDQNSQSSTSAMTISSGGNEAPRQPQSVGPSTPSKPPPASVPMQLSSLHFPASMPSASATAPMSAAQPSPTVQFPPHLGAPPPYPQGVPTNLPPPLLPPNFMTIMQPPGGRPPVMLPSNAAGFSVPPPNFPPPGSGQPRFPPPSMPMPPGVMQMPPQFSNNQPPHFPLPVDNFTQLPNLQSRDSNQHNFLSEEGNDYRVNDRDSNDHRRRSGGDYDREDRRRSRDDDRDRDRGSSSNRHDRGDRRKDWRHDDDRRERDRDRDRRSRTRSRSRERRDRGGYRTGGRDRDDSRSHERRDERRSRHEDRNRDKESRSRWDSGRDEERDDRRDSRRESRRETSPSRDEKEESFSATGGSKTESAPSRREREIKADETEHVVTSTTDVDAGAGREATAVNTRTEQTLLDGDDTEMAMDIDDDSSNHSADIHNQPSHPQGSEKLAIE